MSLTLYELRADYMALLDHIDDEDWDTESLIEMLNEIESDITDKVVSVACVIKNEQAEADAIDAEIKRLTARKRARSNTIARLKDYAYLAMKEVGLKTVDTDPRFKISYQKNPVSIAIKDESLVPVEFRIPQPDAIDKKAALKALKDSGETECEWAVLQQTESLRIR